MRLFGVSLRADFWFWGMLCVYFLLDRDGLAPLALGAMALHEGGHLLLLGAFGEKPASIRFHAGGIAICRGKPLSLGKETAALLGGSGMNFLWVLLCRWWGWDTFGACHLLLGVFNLLPVRGLDGGTLGALWLSRWAPRAAGRLLLLLELLTCGGVSALLLWWGYHHPPGDWRLLWLPLYLLFLIFCS